MGIYLPNMEMPKNCAYCPFSEYMNTSLGQILDCKRIGTVGSAVRGTHDVLNHRHPNCPLVEIPTPHGRLIDADKFAETLKEVSIRQGYDKLFSDNILSVGDVFDAIVADLKGEGLDEYKLAPTVIEAEGSEE